MNYCERYNSDPCMYYRDRYYNTMVPACTTVNVTTKQWPLHVLPFYYGEMHNLDVRLTNDRGAFLDLGIGSVHNRPFLNSKRSFKLCSSSSSTVLYLAP
jgi:hypothetical protein